MGRRRAVRRHPGGGRVSERAAVARRAVARRRTAGHPGRRPHRAAAAVGRETTRTLGPQRLGRLCLRPLHRGFRMERGRMLKVFNTMTGRKDPFEPLVPGQVRMYVCGVTVYDDVHLGHARSAVVFDVIRRYLEYRGFNVTFVKNFTDVDDKIINRARDLSLAWRGRRGPGTPGWHIECSARDMKHLGETFDIHGGGQDLIFPHRENEIAQSCSATDKEFARYWVHNGFVTVDQEKMSKSLGNFFTVKEIFEKWGYREEVTAEAIRYFLLSTHYRSPLDFSDSSLSEAKRALDRLYSLLQRLEESSATRGLGDERLPSLLEQLGNEFRQAMDDDFNTPAAIAQFQHLRGEVNRLLEMELSRKAREKALEAFRALGQVLGLFQISWRDWEFKDLYPPVGWMNKGTQTVLPP